MLRLLILALSSLILAAPLLAVERDITGIVHVIDADTLDVAGQRIRLHAIDAPERDQSCETEQGEHWAGCGEWISKVVTDTYQGTYARCLPVTRDKYERTVARCFVDGRDIGADLVTQGLAFAYLKYGHDYAEHQASAASLKRGLHALTVTEPGQHRKTRAKGQTPPKPACNIKGNISKNGKIYHVPGQKYYDRTGISASLGERWFCSEAEARAAGWRKARR